MTATVGYPDKRARTRAALIRAAMELLGRTGPDGLTVAAVTEAAGVSHGTLYNHVDGTAELEELVADELAAVFARGAEHLDRASVDPAGRVGLGVLQLLGTVETDPVFAAAFVASMSGRTSFRARVTALVESTVQRGVEGGHFDAADARATTEAVVGATLATLRAAVTGTHRADPRVTADLCLRMLGLGAAAREEALSRSVGARAAGADPA